VRKTVVTIVAIIFAMSLAPTGVRSQDYDAVLKSLTEPNKTIQQIKKHYADQGKAPKQYAGTENMAAQTDLNRDVFYEFAMNLENVVTDLQNAMIDSKSAQANQTKNPAGIDHGKIAISGYIHQQYYNEFGENDQSTFVSKRARLGAKGGLNQYAKYKFLGEFASSPKLLDAVLTLSPNNNWSLNVGQFKPPYGAEFLTSAVYFPFVNTWKGKGLGTDRDIGASVTFKNKISPNLNVKFDIGIFNGSGINTSDVNNDKNIVGRMELRLANVITLAPNFIVGKTNDTGILKQDLSTYGGSVNWTWKNEAAQAEYSYSKVGETKKAGWYVWGAHSFVTNAKIFPVVQLLGRYEELDNDTELSGNKVDRITIGANLFIDGKYTKLQLNYQINGEESVSVDNNEFVVNFQVAF